MDIKQIIDEGGFVMYPLIICSLLVWTIFIERIWFLVTIKKQVKSLCQSAGKLIKEGKIQEAQYLVNTLHPLLHAPYLEIFNKGKIPEGERASRIERKLSIAYMSLKRFTWVLGTVGNSAPFIGLFGTVVGIIKSFNSIAVSGKSGFSVVAAGLSEALIATATGILVAVIAVVFYNYIQIKLRDTNFKLKNGLDNLIELL